MAEREVVEREVYSDGGPPRAGGTNTGVLIGIVVAIAVAVLLAVLFLGGSDDDGGDTDGGDVNIEAPEAPEAPDAPELEAPDDIDVNVDGGGEGDAEG